MSHTAPSPPRVPLPDGMKHPLPERLRWFQVIALFEHWNVGDHHYLDDLVKMNAIRPVMRKHRKRGKLYPTEQVVSVYSEG